MNFQALIGNQVFTGVAGAALVSAVLFQLRALPQLVWQILMTQFSANVSVYSEQEAFRQVDLWIGRHPSAHRARRLALTEWWNQADSKSEFELTPGPGPHVLWEGRTPIFIDRSVEAPQGAGSAGPRRQTLTLTTMGRSRKRLEQILEEARSVQDRDVVSVHVWRMHGYELVERRPRRALETIHLSDGLSERIIADAQRFAQRRAWYVERGIPHRRGYLFEGPPGSGKSSMAFALAGALHRAIYVVNPATLSDDNALQSAINQAGSGVVLIEDIDAVDCGVSRAVPAPAALSPSVPSPEGMTRTGISLSGLLNAIDGVAAREGRVLVITSNHAEKLDPALIRPGRVDMRCSFALAGLPEARAMFRRFCPDDDEGAFAREIERELPMSAAELQNRLLARAA